MYNHRKVILFLLCIILFEVCVILGIENDIEKKMNKQMQQKNNHLKMEKTIRMDLKSFPIPIKNREQISFTDTYGANRENGAHEGCDIMYEMDVPGELPIISATDGIVTNLGWLYLGGYRIGITSENNIYYYYAHLDSYSPSLYVGKTVKAGEFLGFMGNTGEGEEGTKGNFPVHLHFGIYIEDKDGNEKTINPYQYLLEINK